MCESSSRGVGSKVIQPYPGNSTSTHAWASAVDTVNSVRSRPAAGSAASEMRPGRNPTATRAGMPVSRSITAIAVA
jgi:hypothetical protein